MNSFFEKNTYIVNQKVWTIANSYKIEDEEGKEIGLIQEDLPFSRILLRMIMNKGMTPFTLNIVDSNQKTLATAKKKFSFMKAAVELLDGNGQCIGFIKQKFTLLKPEYEIQDSEGKAIGKITGNWVAWDYKISDLDGNEIATISKKFKLSLKEVFTDADKYAINIKPEIADEKLRMLALLAAGVIDKVNRENND